MVFFLQTLPVHALDFDSHCSKDSGTLRHEKASTRLVIERTDGMCKEHVVQRLNVSELFAFRPWDGWGFVEPTGRPTDRPTDRPHILLDAKTILQLCVRSTAPAHTDG